ncbi:uncharacterized protein TRIADDRAFT_56712 [Trichoplax adhaerens]|uniref:Uncharacterized protein n=1 Tax=Trichoplax adhaerens TaxID=10228 RepID=B3RWD6_TRIAD|nr:predicted protein [Trichoplax adhaerens]EDV25118.1 predicted protein [Trichoplax adhaerens]|eukprot:XP_002113008.1 predicted protein [Trichoplax adhaerens]
MDNKKQILAWDYYKQGKFSDSFAILNEVHFPTFDSEEIKVQNNKLACRAQSFLLGQDDQNATDILQDLSKLIEIISGLPLKNVMIMRCSLSATINRCILHLQCQSVTPIDELVTELTNCLRSIALVLTEQDIKTDNADDDIGLVAKNIFSWVSGNGDLMIELVPDLWNAYCIMSALLLIKDKYDTASKLLDLLQPSYLDSTEMLESKRDVYTAIKWLACEEINFFYKEILCLQQLTQEISDPTVVHVLQGFNSYKLNRIDQALDYFKVVCSQPNEVYKATAFNMIGCCFASQKKYITALLNYKEALSISIDNVEPLLNIAKIFRVTGAKEKEVQMLQYLADVLHLSVAPDISIIYRLAITSLLCNCQYDDALIICNYLVSIMEEKVGHIEDEIEKLRSSSSYMPVTSDANPSKKRKVTKESLSTNNNIRLFLQVLLMKADALYHQKQFEEASQLFTKALQIVNKVLPMSYRLHMQDDLVVGDPNGYFASIAKIKSRILNNIALIKINQGKLSDGLKLLQDSFHFNEANREAAYNCTILLFMLERQRDACFSWLKYRKVATNVEDDEERSNTELRDKLMLLRSSEVSQEDASFRVSDYMALQLDIHCLEVLNKIQKTSKGRNVIAL